LTLSKPSSEMAREIVVTAVPEAVRYLTVFARRRMR
jgi:hypothetical protein